MSIIVASSPRQPSGASIVAPVPREGSSVVIVTHNWCDPCTWFGESIRAVNEVLVDSGDGRTFTSLHTHWIDLNHGRHYGEDKIKADYLPEIRVDDVDQAEREPFELTGGDFVVDYEAGTITFAEAQVGVVLADYSYAAGSRFTVSPDAGKILAIESSEVQFSQDVVIQDTIHFQPWAYNPYDPPNKVPAASATTYKRMRDYVDEARGVYPPIEAIGGSARGLQQAHIVFPFDYMTIKELNAAYGVEVRVWLDKDRAHLGEFATASFYCTSRSIP